MDISIEHLNALKDKLEYERIARDNARKQLIEDARSRLKLWVHVCKGIFKV